MNPKGMTRADAIKYITNNQLPEDELLVFMNEHPNYHVRERAWRRLGSPVPEDASERITLLKLIRPNLHKQVERATEPVILLFGWINRNVVTEKV